MGIKYPRQNNTDIMSKVAKEMGISPVVVDGVLKAYTQQLKEIICEKHEGVIIPGIVSIQVKQDGAEYSIHSKVSTQLKSQLKGE